MHFVGLLIEKNPLCATALLTSAAKSYVLLEKLLGEVVPWSLSREKINFCNPFISQT